MDLWVYLQGDLYDHQSLVNAIKQVDAVISTVGALQLADQTKIISAIKEAGNVKVRTFSLSYPFSDFSFACTGTRTITIYMTQKFA